MLYNLSGMVSSLNAQQTRMDVIANNIANSDTLGYKKSRLTFGDALYTSMYAPGMPVAKNVRCGSGTMVSGIDKEFGEGVLVPTEGETDLAIDGEGFFGLMLEDGSMAYTRSGNFHLDGEKNLVSAQGAYLYTDMVLPEDCTKIAVSGSGEITAQLSDGTTGVVGSIPIFSISNPSGLKALGNGFYQETEASGTVSQGTGGSNGLGSIKQGFLEQSNVDLGEEFTSMIVAQRSFQFSAQTIRTLDEMWGMANSLQR